jgi:ABC-type dipeptide/oligopeptide/nickel transport system permease component
VTVTRADIEAKARQINQVITDTKEAAQNTAMLAGVAVVVVVAVAYLLGRRKSRSGKAVVEVYRI